MLGGALTGWVLHWMLDAWYWRRNSIQAVDLTPVQQELHRKDAAHLHQHLTEPAPTTAAPTGAFLAGESEASVEPVKPTSAPRAFDPNVDLPQKSVVSPIRLEDGPLAPIDRPISNALAGAELSATSAAIPRFTFPYIEVEEPREAEEDRGPVLPGLDDEPIVAEQVVLHLASDDVSEASATRVESNGHANGMLGHHEPQPLSEDTSPEPSVPSQESVQTTHRDEAHRQLQEALRQVAHLKNTLSRRGIPHDDLQSIRGIGPYAEHKLVAAGIDSFQALAQSSAVDIESIIQPQSWQPIHAAQWIADAQAKLSEGENS